MIRLLILTFVLCAWNQPLFGQDNVPNYTIHISGVSTHLESSLEGNWNALKSNLKARSNGRIYALVQLQDIPTTEEKEALRTKGIELLNYVPNYAWIAKVNPELELADLQKLKVRAISEVSELWKAPTEMREGVIPIHAGNIDDLHVRVLFWKENSGIDYVKITQEFTSNLVKTNLDQSWIEIKCPLSKVLEMAQHPLVQYIEFSEPPIEQDGILDESERIISTYISNNPGKNYYFDGSGVKIGVEEGNMVDTLENPNFRSRLDRSSESGTTVNGHKTGVALRMAGAGNIDPKEQGTAYGAEIHSGGFNFATAAGNDITIINRSVGWGCPSGTETYSSSSVNYDNLVRTYPSFMITHSAGNIGGSLCYAGSAGWGNITGLPKMAKNIFVVGSSGSDGTLTGFSSRGPAKDGRILPSIVAPGGGGTSHASPNLAGVYGQLNHAYRYHNGGVIPNSGLLKAVIMNTADDMLNPGPDFKTGFGHVNARRAYEVIRQGQFLNSTISQGGNNVHSITVPANVKEVKVMVYWVDWEATAGITTKALVNDLDIDLLAPNAIVYQPWVLDPAFDPVTLDNFAIRATDTLNNVEQITIDDPIAGVYQLSVAGTMIPQGPQEYFMTYEFVYDDIFVTHPHGGERLVPNETERIRWDACDSNLTFDLSYSLDNGGTWNSIVTGVNADDRYYDWTIPTAITDQALVRVERGTTVGESDTTFSILDQPGGLQIIWSCADSSLIEWDEYQGADGYVVYRIVGDYMDSIAYTSSTSMVLNGLSLIESEYISIAVVQNGVTSRRIIAIERVPSDINCNLNDVGSLEFVSPGAENLPSCMAGANSEIELLIKNWGINTVDSVLVAYQVNGGSIIYDTILGSIATGADTTFTFSTSPNFGAGLNDIVAWTQFINDGILTNDTVSTSINVYTSTSSGAAIVQDFDQFTTCSTAWGCETISCAMEDGWYNITNAAGDDIDWRTNNGGTGTGGTGPSGDHTSGSGNYLYLEGSGNGGSGCLNSVARLHSPCIDMTGVNQAEMSFWYHAYGSGIGELHVDAIADGVLFEDIMTPIVGAQGDLWINEIVDISQFTDTRLVVVIRGVTGGGFATDLAIDDINISTSPIADFVSTETQLCSSDIITLNNFTVYGDTYEWIFTPNTVTFEGGTNSNSTSPQVSFNGSGLYSIQLIATNTIGADSLTQIDYIYVWDQVPSLSGNPYCEYDQVIVNSNNNGQPVEYYLNGSVESSSTNSIYHYQNAVEGDTIYVAYDVNSGCTLYSDTIIVDIVDVNSGVVQNGLALDALASGAAYQWLDCDNNYAPISGETNQSFTPLADGEYAVQVIENGCIDTSDCIVFSTISIQENDWEALSYYPNPTTDDITIDLGDIHSGISIKVHNLLGQVITEKSFENTDKIQLNLPEESAVYLIEIRSHNKIGVIRVVKEKG